MRHLLLSFLAAGAALGYAAYLLAQDGKEKVKEAAVKEELPEEAKFDPEKDADKELKEQLVLCVAGDGTVHYDLIEKVAACFVEKTGSDFDRLDKMIAEALVTVCLFFVVNEVPRKGWTEGTLKALLEKARPTEDDKPGDFENGSELDELLAESAEKHPECPYMSYQLKYYVAEAVELTKVIDMLTKGKTE